MLCRVHFCFSSATLEQTLPLREGRICERSEANSGRGYTVHADPSPKGRVQESGWLAEHEGGPGAVAADLAQSQPLGPVEAQHQVLLPAQQAGEDENAAGRARSARRVASAARPGYWPRSARKARAPPALGAKARRRQLLSPAAPRRWPWRSRA